MSEDTIVVHINGKKKLQKGNILELVNRLASKLFDSECSDHEYDAKEKTLTLEGSLKSVSKTELAQALSNAKRITGAPVYLELFYEMTGETEWYALIDKKAHMFSSRDELEIAVLKPEKEDNVYPNTETEAIFESGQYHHLLLRFYCKTKKKLSELSDRFQTISENPTIDNINSAFANLPDYHEGLNDSDRDFLRGTKFASVEGNYLYVGISLDHLPERCWGEPIGWSELIIFYITCSLCDKLIIRERFCPGEQDYYITETPGNDPNTYDALRKGKNCWLPAELDA